MTKKHLNRDREQSDIKVSLEDSVGILRITVAELHMKLDRIEEQHTHIHIVLKRIEKLLEGGQMLLPINMPNCEKCAFKLRVKEMKE